MPELVINSVDYAYFLYGLSFFILGSAAFVVSRIPKIPLSWHFFVTFCFLNGVQIWLGLFSYSLGPGDNIGYLRLAFFIAAFLSFIEFGRQIVIRSRGINLNKWLLAFFVILLFLGIFLPSPDGLNNASHYILGFVGSIFVSWAIFGLLKSKTIHVEPWFVVFTATATFLYGLTFLVAAPANFFPASLINYISFERYLGFPIQLIRGLLSALTTGGLLAYWALLKTDSGQFYFHLRRRKVRQIVVAALVFSLIIALGWVLTFQIGEHNRHSASKEFFKKTLPLSTDILSHRLIGIFVTICLCIIYLSIILVLELNRNTASRISNSENRFRLIFEHAPEAIFIMDILTHKILAANPFAERWLGYSLQELLNLTLNDILDMDSSAIQNLIAKIDRDGALLVPDRNYIKKNGQKINMEVITARIDFQGRTSILIFARDATERKLLEQQLRHLASFPEINPNPVLELNRSGKITFYNNATIRILKELGYEVKEAYLFAPKNLSEFFDGREQNKTVTSELEIRGRTFLNTIAYVFESDSLRIYVSDITQSIRANKERDRVFNLSFDMICIAGFDGYFKQLNPAWAKTLGWTNEELLAKPFFDLVHLEDLGRVREEVRQLTEGKVVVSFEHRYLCCDGTYKWISLNAFPVLEEKLIFAIARDSSASKKAEELLVRERDRARMYFDIAGVIFIVLNSVGEVVGINKKGCRILGYPEEDIIGRLWSDNFVPETIRPTVEGVFAEIKKGNIELFEYFENPIINKNNEERLVAWHNTIIRDESGNITHILSSGEDITERRHIEDLLQEQLYFSQVLIDNIPNPVFYEDTHGVYLGCNAAFEKFIGMSKKEITGKAVFELYPQDSADIHDRKDKELFNSPGTQTYESRVLHIDGTRHEVIFSKATYLNRYGLLIGIVGVILDVTELKMAYEKLKNTQSQLIQIEKMNVIGTMASGIAHEVKNPLAIIMQGVNFLEKDIRPEDSNQLEVVQIMKEAIIRAEKIIHSLLDFSRRAPFEFKTCSINKIAEASFALVPKKFIPLNIKISMDLNCQAPDIKADENNLEQALINLIINSLQAMPEGGDLIVRTYNKGFQELNDGIGRKVGDYFQSGDLAVIVEIEDSGKGIPGDMFNKIFDPFFTTKPPGEGVGLGLSIARSIVDSHRGLINISSQEGKGSKFTITLPAAKSKT